MSHRSRWLWIAAACAVAGVLWVVGAGDAATGRASAEEPRPAEGAAGRDASPLRQSVSAAEERAAVGEPPPGELRAAAGALHLLALPSREAPVGSRWRFDPLDGAGAGPVTAGGGEAVALPSGRWRVACVEGGWRPLEEVVELEPGGSRVAWVHRPATLALRVRDDAGVPVPGAEAVWYPTTADREVEIVARARAVTDETGRAELPLASAPIGWVGVAAEGFETVRRVVSGPRRDALEVHLRRASGAARAIAVVDAGAGTPIAGAEVAGVSIPFHRRTGAEGVFHLDPWLPPDARLAVRAEGYLPIRVSTDRLDGVDVLSLHRAVACAIAPGEPGEPAPAGERVLLRIDESIPAHVDPRFERELVTGAAGRAEAIVPAGLALRALAVLRDGRAGEAPFRVERDGTVIRVPLLVPPVLVLDAVDAEGTPIAGARAAVGYDSGASATLAGATMRVPAPDGVRRIHVGAPGYANANLEHVRGEGLRRSGRLIVRLERECVLRLRAIDRDRAPVRGIRIGVHAAFDRERFEAHRELHGAWPTAHEGWARRDPPYAYASTDAEGRACVRGLPPGLHDVSTGAPRVLNPASLVRDSHERVRVELPHEGEVELPVSNLRRVVLRVRDGRDGAPVRGIVVTLPGNFYVEELGDPASDTWDSFVSADVAEIEVGAKGYALARVALGSAPSDHETVVDLRPADPLLVRLEGAVADLQGGTLHWQGFDDWMGHGSGSEPIPASLEVAIAPPLEAGFRLLLEVDDASGRRMRTEPEMVEWEPGAEVELRVAEPGP